MQLSLLRCFSTLSCAIRFIVTVEIASVFGVTQHERKVAKKQETPEMARPEQPRNAPRQKLQNIPHPEVQSAVERAPQKIPFTQTFRKEKLERTQTPH